MMPLAASNQANRETASKEKELHFEHQFFERKEEKGVDEASRQI